MRCTITDEFTKIRKVKSGKGEERKEREEKDELEGPKLWEVPWYQSMHNTYKGFFSLRKVKKQKRSTVKIKEERARNVFEIRQIQALQKKQEHCCADFLSIFNINKSSLSVLFEMLRQIKCDAGKEREVQYRGEWLTAHIDVRGIGGMERMEKLLIKCATDC